MKSHSLKLTLVSAALVLGVASPAFASEAEDLFKRMDTDGNGKVTAVEHAAFAETMFKQSDTNYDGQLSAAECTAAKPRSRKDVRGSPGDAPLQDAGESQWR